MIVQKCIIETNPHEAHSWVLSFGANPIHQDRRHCPGISDPYPAEPDLDEERRILTRLVVGPDYRHQYDHSPAFRMAIDNLVETFLPAQVVGLSHWARKADKASEDRQRMLESMPPAPLFVPDALLWPNEPRREGPYGRGEIAPR